MTCKKGAALTTNQATSTAAGAVPAARSAPDARATLRAEFDDCEVTIGPGTTTLRAELPDQAALAGLLQRITGLRLELIHMHLVAPPPADG